MSFTPEQLAKLERLRHHGTAYEAEIVAPNGRRALLCYTQRKTGSGLWDACTDRGAAVLAFLACDDETTMRRERKTGRIVFSNGGFVRFTGRTQRDVIMGNDPLPYVGAA